MIELREFIESDADALVELANNKNVSRYLTSDFPFPYTADDAQWWIGTGSKEGIQRAILLNGQLVGSVGASPGVGEREKQVSSTRQLLQSHFISTIKYMMSLFIQK
jgi:[ribosomal protein S5]-alanine N-acetyltransferase